MDLAETIPSPPCISGSSFHITDLSVQRFLIALHVGSCPVRRGRRCFLDVEAGVLMRLYAPHVALWCEVWFFFFVGDREIQVGQRWYKWYTLVSLHPSYRLYRLSCLSLLFVFRCMLGDNCCGWRKWRSGFRRLTKWPNPSAVKPLCEQWYLVSFLPSWATQHQTTQNDRHEQTVLLHRWYSVLWVCNRLHKKLIQRTMSSIWWWCRTSDWFFVL